MNNKKNENMANSENANHDNLDIDHELFAEGVMLYNDDDPLWKKEIMIAQIMIYALDGISQETLEIVYGHDHVDKALDILNPGRTKKLANSLI